MQVTLSKDAIEAIGKHLEQNDYSAVRFYTQGSCCGEAQFKLSLGNPEDGDAIIEAEGFKFVLPQDVADSLVMIHIDHYPRVGFRVRYEAQDGFTPGSSCIVG